MDTGVMTIILSVLGAFIVSMILERSSSVSRWAIKFSTNFLPELRRLDSRNQWIADNDDVSGPSWKLIHAFGCAWLCRQEMFFACLGWLNRKSTQAGRAATWLMSVKGKSEPTFILPSSLKNLMQPKSVMLLQKSDGHEMKSADINEQEFGILAYLRDGRTIDEFAHDANMTPQKAEQAALDLAIKLDEIDLESIRDQLHMFDYGGK